MFRYLAVPGLLLSLSCSVFAQSKSTPAVAILRDIKTVQEGADNFHDQAVLLDSHANEITTIPGLGLGQSISCQNTVLIDVMHDRLLLVENLRDRLSVFHYNGTPQLTIPVKNANAIVMTDDANQIGCVVGTTLAKHETAFFDAMTGTETRRLNLGGVALANDLGDSQFWAVGVQVIAFAADGEIRVRRPLTQLPAEPDNPTVINSRNWCAVGVAIESNKNDWMRSIWIIERDHPDVKGSKNRLFAVDPDGQTRILVELGDIDPRSIACATYNSDLTRILVVDGATGDLVSFNSDGELMGRNPLHINLVRFGKTSGLWAAGGKSVMRLNPSDLSVLSIHTFEDEADPVGLAVR